MKKEGITIKGIPNERQKSFFASHTRFTAYGGARGGGKSWALRRKLVAMCLRYDGISCLLIRRTLPELRSNHVIPFLREYDGIITYSESERAILFPNKSKVYLGYCATDKDVLRYQGQEYDVIAIDEATQLSEFRFSVLKACLRGANDFPRRMYLTCNPGGIGHAWVKRLFVDRDFKNGENPEEYSFIPALVYDNPILLDADPEYINSLKSLPPRLKDAWLLGKWDVFDGQFFPEFDTSTHLCRATEIPKNVTVFVALDYGLDMLAALLMGIDAEGNLGVMQEHCESGLTLREAANRVALLADGKNAEFAVCSPDLWNRRQDSGKSGFEVMQSVRGMPAMRPADNRRIPGWRMLREYFSAKGGHPFIRISDSCNNLISSLPALLCDPKRPEDASSTPHAITHSPEALRYAAMSRVFFPNVENDVDLSFLKDFHLPKKPSFFD